MTRVERGILAAVCFYDVFDYPLTVWEIFKFFHDVPGEKRAKTNNSISLGEIHRTLEENTLRCRLGCRHGFYFLRGRVEIVRKRSRRHAMAIAKWEKARRATRLLRAVPFVKMVALCNTNAIDAVRSDSDIDFFIVATNNRLWITRALTTTVFFLFGKWRHTREKTSAVRDKLCLSFFVSERAQCLEHLQKTDYDPYLINWVALVAPIYIGHVGADTSFWRDNAWIKRYLPQARPISVGHRRRVESGKNRLGRAAEILLRGKLGDRLEQLAHWLQFKYMKRRTDKIAMTWSREEGYSLKRDSDVVVSRDILKFHEVDKRLEYKQKYLKRLSGKG